MIRAYLIELILLLLVLWAVGFGLVKLWFLIKGESEADRIDARRTKRDAGDALDDLDHAISRVRKKKDNQ